MDQTYNTQGSELYFVDPDTHLAVKMACPTGITGLAGGAADEIGADCLDNVSGFHEVKGGMATPAPISVPFILYKSAASHQLLFDLQESREIIDWMAAFADSTAVPTVDTDFNLEAPSDRTTISFNGFVQNVTIDIATNEIVRGTLTIKRSGGQTFHWPA